MAIAGRFLLGCNSTYPAGSTGGEATHKLTIDEMPSHYHTLGYDARKNATSLADSGSLGLVARRANKG